MSVCGKEVHDAYTTTDRSIHACTRTTATGHSWSTKARTDLLTNLADVAVDTQGHVYVSEGSVNLIHELSPTGASLVTWQ